MTEGILPAYKTLVNELVAAGCMISVFDGECWEPKRSTDSAAINAAIESVEEANLLVRNSHGQDVGRAYVSAYGLAPDETVIDHTIGLEQYAPSLNSESSEE